MTEANLLLIKAKKPDIYILLGRGAEAEPRFVREKDLVDVAAAIEKNMQQGISQESVFPVALSKELLEA